MERTKRFFAIIAAGAVLFGCGDPGGQPLNDVPGEPSGTDRPFDRVDPVEEEEVDYQGFTVAPPPGPEDGAPKQSFDEKLAETVESTEVPSTLAGAFFYLGRAYLSGRQPLTSIEASAFEIFDNASSETLQVLDRTLRRIDELPQEDMAALYGADFIRSDTGFALTAERLGNAMIDEIKRRASLSEYGDPDIPLDQERAGLVREMDVPYHDASDGFISVPMPNICEVKTEAMGAAPGVRTGSFIPKLGPGGYDPRELDGRQIGDCRGEQIGTGDSEVCLRLPEVRPNEIVRLEGFNFHDVDAEVQLVPWLGNKVESQVLPTMNAEAHVRGATVSWRERAQCESDGIRSGSGLGEVVTRPGQTAGATEASSCPPADCTAGDVIHFQVPNEIQSGVYKVRLVMKDPNRAGYEVMNIGFEPFVQVVSPASTRFTITAESLVAAYYDGFEWGRHEISLKFYLLSEGELGMDQFKIGKVKNFEHRCVGETNDRGECNPTTLFAGAPGAGIAFAVVGMEVDNEEAYEKEIREWDELYSLVSEQIYGEISQYVSKGIAALVTYLSGSKEAGKTIGDILNKAFLAAVALYAPAETVIVDRDAFSFAELDSLTSPLAPLPRPHSYSVDENKVEVLVEPCTNRVERRYQADCLVEEAKGPGVYREIREYNVGFPEFCRDADGCHQDWLDGTLHWLNLRYDRIY